MKTQNDKITYYAIAGSNGYGIYTDLTKAQEAACYLSNFHWKKFYSFVQAKQWANENFLNLQPHSELYAFIEPITKSNWCYFKKR